MTITTKTKTIEGKVPHYVEDILEGIAVLKSKVLRGKSSHKTLLLDVIEHFVPLIKADIDSNVAIFVNILLSFEEEVAIDAVKHINILLLREWAVKQ